VLTVEPICKALQFAPSVYYDVKSRPPSRRSVSDAELKVKVLRAYKEGFEAYGSEKIWRQLHREGIACGGTGSPGSCASSASPASCGASPGAPPQVHDVGYDFRSAAHASSTPAMPAPHRTSLHADRMGHQSLFVVH
jgi:hypothetical protein